MPRSPKRNGMLVEEEDWPLRSNMSIPRLTIPDSSMPRLTLSSTSSNEHIDDITPSTPTDSLEYVTPSEERLLDLTLATTSEEPVLLPGFHFSTTDEDVDPAEFHRVAAQLLSGAPSEGKPKFAQEIVQQSQERQLHCDLGKDPSGRYCCSCGKSFSTSFRMREHVQQCAGTGRHPCSTCDKVFDTRDKLNRHVASRHNNNLESCPECGKLFPANMLPKHLASGLGGCDGMVQLAMGPAPAIDEAYGGSQSRKSTSQHYWIYDGDLSWGKTRISGHDSLLEDAAAHDGVVDQTMSYVKDLLTRPASHPHQEACDLCGDVFSTETDELAQHIGTHSLEFTEKRHKCDECRIFFANEKDLERHLQSANLNQHCGFTFRHESGSCDGHHPPTYFKSSLESNHNLMQKHLWAWELAQLRTHRLIVARLLAERLNKTSSSKHMSLQNCRRTYVSLLPHVSIASSDSLRPESGWMTDRCESETASLDAYFGRMISEAFPQRDEKMLERIEESEAILEFRPDSSTLSKGGPRRKSWTHVSRWRSSTLDSRRKMSALENVKKQEDAAHKRSQSGPVQFLKQASRDANRPQSLPTVVKAG